jgi:tripeptidyl-peptidase-1
LTFSEESVNTVKAWLASLGVSSDRIRQSHGLSWLQFNASAGQAGSLLRAKYHFWEHDSTGNTHVACDEYSLPSDIRKHVDFILPSVHFDSRIGPRSEGRDRLKSREADRVRIGDPQSDGWLPKAVQWIDKSDLHHELVGCDQQTTPECLRALYGIPVNEEAVEGNSFGVAEFTPQAYVPTDLDIFFSNFSDKLVGERPILKTAQGAIVQQQNKSCAFNCESNLDLQYAMTLVYPQQVTLYQVGDVIGGASFNNFLDAFDATYCDRDDPAADAVYPDPTPGGYKGLKTCGAYDAAKVVTISYAYNEHDLMPAYEQRQCNEYLKLGLMGTSFLVSSGDNGVAGNGDQCIDPSDRRPGANASYTDGSSGIFNPMFPAVCPYVTAVGATQIIGGTNIVRALASNKQPEETLAQVAFSGGGFSNVFAMPDYQAETVHEWFKKHPPIYGSDRFNNSQRTRGFPDISANGANYAFAVNAEWSLTYGTSASAPVLGSILTLINQERLKAGKSSIGFINPTAYAHPEVFTDVTTGNNGGCGVDGWFAVPGWDPVTGLGTPNYPKMLELWMSLP